MSVDESQQELVVPIKPVSNAISQQQYELIENNNNCSVSNGKGTYRVVGSRGKGNGGDGDNGDVSSSSSTSNKNGRASVQSSSLNRGYTNDSGTRRNRHDSNSDEPSLQSTSSNSKYNTNNGDYYHFQKSVDLRDGRSPGTPKCNTLITAALDNLKDDIAYEKRIHNSGNGRHHLRLKTVSELVSLGTGFNSDRPIHKQQFFMEDRNGVFLPTTRSTALQNKERTVWLEQVPELDLQTSLDFAIIVQKVFTPISNIAFGLLGGVALMQIFMSYSYLQNRHSMHDMTAFIESYYIFARVAPTAFYILLAICIVAVFDRFDLAHLDLRHCSDTLLYRHGWCLLIIYMITLLLTLCAAELDDMLLLYPYDKSFSTNEPELYHRLSSWHTLNISRCIFAVLGWIIIALSQPEDLLLHHLKSIKQFDVQHAKEILVVRSPSTTNNIVY